MSLRYDMLDPRKACVPGHEDWSDGHIRFDSGAYKLPWVGYTPGSFDLDSDDFDREKVITLLVEELKNNGNDQVLRALFGSVLDQARAHCDEHHADLRESRRKSKT